MGTWDYIADGQISLFDFPQFAKREEMRIEEIPYNMAKEFLLPRHYSGRVPNIKKAFGWFSGDSLKAVCTFGKPASNNLCIGVCGREHSSSVYELNRLCRVEDFDLQLSQFVAGCLRRLKPLNWIVVSYSDTQMNHHGYIYQACNFIYTGATKQRTDIYTPDGKHSRHYHKGEVSQLRKVRFSKHRYIYFCTRDKRLLKEWESSLMYDKLPYPKGDNSTYVLGDYMKDVFVNKCK